MPPTMSLPRALVEKLGITREIAFFDGGQKYVFIVDCGGRRVVVKMLKGYDPERDARELEFYLQNTGNAGIPNITGHFLFGTDMVVVEEFVEGESLATHCVKGTYLNDDTKILSLLKNVCVIMTPFWEQGIVHRDLKPDNVLIRPDGQPVVIDFGIYKNPINATITDTTFQPHSWQFAAPEQLFPDKNAISNRTDFFSLGVIVYRLKYGMLPFGDSKEAIMAKYENDDFTFYVHEGCIFAEFLKRVFQFAVSSRPRNTDLFLRGL